MLSHEATVLTRQCQNQERQQKSLQDALSRAHESNRERLNILWNQERSYSQRLAKIAFLRDRLVQLKSAVSSQ